MKKLLLLLLIAPVIGLGQGEQRYADGTAIDQNGNTFEWINYGTQDWAIENAEVETYRDGTPIPHVTGRAEWVNLTTGAWCYYNNDPSKGKLYNWYAVAGIYDEASLNDESLRKEFITEGWRVPTDDDWTTLETYLIANGYNHDQTTAENKIAKAMASTTGWNSSAGDFDIGNDQSLNNLSGFNTFPVGARGTIDSFIYMGYFSFFWSSTEYDTRFAWHSILGYNQSNLRRAWGNFKQSGFSVRFVRDASTASTKDYSKPAAIYPNPTSSIINIEQDFTTAKIYDISGRELLKSSSKTIDLSELPSSIYLLRLYDNNNKVLGTSKVVKQ